MSSAEQVNSSLEQAKQHLEQAGGALAGVSGGSTQSAGALFFEAVSLMDNMVAPLINRGRTLVNENVGLTNTASTNAENARNLVSQAMQSSTNPITPEIIQGTQLTHEISSTAMQHFQAVETRISDEVEGLYSRLVQTLGEIAAQVQQQEQQAAEGASIATHIANMIGGATV